MGHKSREGLPWEALDLYDSAKESSPIGNQNLVIDFDIRLKTIRGWFIHQKSSHITGKRKTRIVKQTLTTLYRAASVLWAYP